MAVNLTVEAAKYLASQRQKLAPRQLVLACSGVNAEQYYQCISQVIEYADNKEWCGLRGWSKLGIYRSRLPTFYKVLHQCIPVIATSKVCHIHLFGVLLEQALAPLLFLADRYCLSVSCDSNRPLLDLTRRDPKRAGVRSDYWRNNVTWWHEYCASLRYSKFYCEPPRVNKQLLFV